MKRLISAALATIAALFMCVAPTFGQAISRTRYLSSIGGSVSAPTFTWAVDPTLGLYRVSSGLLGISGGVKLQNGSSLWSGTGAPGSGLGANGDFYFRSDTSQIYSKAAGAWTLFSSGGGGVTTTGAFPLFGDGAGGIANGTIQGNTTKVVTYAGSLPASNDCAKFDASGNVTTAGSACGSGGTSSVNGGGAPYIVQWTASQSSGSVASITSSGITTTTGNALVAVVTAETNLPSATGVTDNGTGTTWTRNVTASGDSKVAIYTAPNVTGRSGHTVTYTPATSDFVTLTVLELKNVPTSAIVDATNSSAVLSAIHNSGGITASAGVAEILIGAGGTDHGTEGVPRVSGSNWSTVSAAAASGTNEGYVVGTRTVASGTADQFSWTGSATFTEPAAIIGIKGAISGVLSSAESHTASASSTLDFVSCIDGTSRGYRFELTGIEPSAANANLNMLVSTNGGTTWASSNYKYSVGYTSSAPSTGGASASNAGTFIRVGGGVNATAANTWMSGAVRWHNLDSATRGKSAEIDVSFFGNDSNVYRFFGAGNYDSASPVNAVRFTFDAGTIAEGTIACYREPN